MYNERDDETMERTRTRYDAQTVAVQQTRTRRTLIAHARTHTRTTIPHAHYFSASDGPTCWPRADESQHNNNNNIIIISFGSVFSPFSDTNVSWTNTHDNNILMNALWNGPYRSKHFTRQCPVVCTYAWHLHVNHPSERPLRN